MEDVIEYYYSDVALVTAWHSDGHHSDLADMSSDPLTLLILEEEED